MENNELKEQTKSHPIETIGKILFLIVFIIIPIMWNTLFGRENSESTVNKPETFYGYECTSDCSGHEVGYEWAENKNINDFNDCGGNSNSFIEGCKAYVSGEYNFGNNE